MSSSPRIGRLCLLLVATACSANLKIPDGVSVVCDSDAQCPQGARCNPLKNICDFNTGPAAPSVALATIGDPAGGRAAAQVPFSFDALDPNAPPVGSDVVSFTYAYSIDGATWCPATVIGDAPAIRAQATHVTLLWDALTDATSACALATTTLLEAPDDGAIPVAALAYQSHVQLRVTATDSTNQNSDATSSAFAVGNDAGVFAFVDDGGVLRGQSALEYGITDSSQDAVTLDVQFRIVGDTTWHPASLRGSVAGLIADPVGAPTSRFIVWQANAPLPADATTPAGLGPTNGQVDVRARSVETSLAGVTTYGPWSTINRDVLNETPPVVGGVTAAAIEPGVTNSLVRISYRIFDAEADPVDVRVEYSVGAIKREATPYPGFHHSGTRSLAASADTSPTFTFVWDVAADLTDQIDAVSLSVTAADIGAIGPTETVTLPFAVGRHATTQLFPTPTTTTLGTTTGTNSDPLSVDMGDFNGDGTDDYIVLEGGRLEVFIANTTTKLPTTPARVGTESFLRTLRLADFNEDNRVDVVAYSARDGMFLAMGAASGLTLAAFPNTVNIGIDDDVVATADFNHDGHADIAYANGSNLCVNLGAGNGTFAAPVCFATGTDLLFALAAGDFNGDGFDDIAYMIKTSDGIHSGNFGDTFPVSAEARMRLGSASAAVFSAADDAAAAGFIAEYDVGSSETHGLFAPITAADVFGNGHDALFVADMLQNNAGRLQMFTYDNGSLTQQAKIDSLGLIGHMHRHHNVAGDYVVLTPRGVPSGPSVTAYTWNADVGALRIANPTFSEAAADLTLPDVDHDGRPDLVLVTGGTLVTYLAHEPSLFFDDSATLRRPLATGTNYLVGGDIDGDLLGDVLSLDNTQFASHTIESYAAGVDANTGAPTCLLPVAGPPVFQLPAGATTTNATDPINVGDFDGDGSADLIVNGSASSYLLRGSAEFAFTQPAPVAGTPTFDSLRAVADFNTDGHDDIAWGFETGAHQVEIDTASVVGGAFQNFTVTTLSDGSTNAVSTIAGDVDNDGHDDVALLRSSTVDIFFGGAGSVCTLNIANTNAAIADFDNDGRNDLVIAGSANVTAYSVTACSATAGPAVTGVFHDIFLRDLNADGFLDLIGISGAATYTVYLGNGSGYAAGFQLPPVSAAPSVTDFIDINGDTLPELLLGTFNSGLAWRLNRRLSGTPAWETTLDTTHFIGGTVPAVDRFGAPWVFPIEARRVTDMPLGVHAREDMRGGFAYRLRRSGVAGTLPTTAIAITDTWEFGGDVALRIAAGSSAAEATNALEAYGRPDVVLDLPVNTTRFGAVDATHTRVFARLVIDVERDGAADTLPRTPSGAPRIIPVANWVEVPLDADGDLHTGTGPRFVTEADVVHIATPSLGVFRAFKVP